MSDPAQIGTTVEQVLRGQPLSAPACVPKRICDLLGWRRRFEPAELTDPVQEPQGGGLPDRRRRTPLQEPARGAPLREDDRIRHRRAAGKHGTRRLDVSATVQKRVEHGDIITTRGPVQRRLGGPLRI